MPNTVSFLEGTTWEVWTASPVLTPGVVDSGEGEVVHNISGRLVVPRIERYSQDLDKHLAGPDTV